MEQSRALHLTVDRALVGHGAVMTLLGLLSGFSPVFAAAPRAALSAHTLGVLQGAMLFGLAAIWPSLGVRPAVTAARWCALVGFYANWLGVQLAALWNAKGMFLVHGSSMAGAAPWREGIVAVLLNLSALIIPMCVLIIWVVRQPEGK